MLFFQVDICSVLPGSEYLISDYIYLHLISEGEQHSTPNLSNTELYFFSHNAIYEEICEKNINVGCQQDILQADNRCQI